MTTLQMLDKIRRAGFVVSLYGVCPQRAIPDRRWGCGAVNWHNTVNIPSIEVLWPTANGAVRRLYSRLRKAGAL